MSKTLNTPEWHAFLKLHFPKFAGRKPKEMPLRIRCTGRVDCINSIVIASPAEQSGYGLSRRGWAVLFKQLGRAGWYMNIAGMQGVPDPEPVFTLVCPECAEALVEDLHKQ